MLMIKNGVTYDVPTEHVERFKADGWIEYVAPKPKVTKPKE